MDIFNKKLEVPYNFDKDLITGLSIIDPPGQYIHCIYTAPYRADYKAAKYNYQHGPSGNRIEDTQTMSREEYESHIAYINEKFPKKLMLLLQRTSSEDVMSKEMLAYYIKLGFNNFCVGSIEQAKLIKQINPFAELTASISMKLSVDELTTNKELRKYFKNVVLWFPYNRNLENIIALPKNFKYILLVNCTCNIKCDGTHHWFADQDGEDHNTCPNRLCCTEWTSIYIRPTDIPIFSKYISYLKLQGREYKTSEVLEDFILYTTNKFNDGSIPLDLNLYKHKSEEELDVLEIESLQKINNFYKDSIELNDIMPGGKYFNGFEN